MVKATFSLLISKYGFPTFAERKGILNHVPSPYKPMIFWSENDEAISTTPVTNIYFDGETREYIVRTGDGLYQVRLGE